MSFVDWLTRRFPDTLGESPAQRARNMATGQKPDSMTWEQWCDTHRPGVHGFNLGAHGYECHWYDPQELTPVGHCIGALRHNHQPQIMKWYWNPRNTVFIWPVMVIDEVSEWLAERRWWHRYVLRHQITRVEAISPTRVSAGIAVYEQDTFRRPDEHHKCACGETWGI